MSFNYNEMFQKAFSLHKRNKVIEAEEIYKALLTVKPDDVNILNLLGMLYISQNRSKEALDCLSEAFIIKKSPYIASNLAKAYYTDKQYEKAVTVYKTALSYGASDDIYYSLALAYKKLNDNENVILNYKKALELNPNNYNAGYNLALAYKENGQNQNALDIALKCAEIKEDDDDLFSLISACYQDKGDIFTALLYMEKACAIMPDFFTYRYNIGVLYSKLGIYKKAIQAYEKALALNDKSAETYVNIANSYRTVDLNKSREYIEKAFELKPKEPLVCLSYAQILRDMYLNDDSIKILRTLLMFAPDNADAYSLLGINCMDSGEYEKALNYYESALKLRSDYTDFLHGKAVALKYLGRIDEAKKILESVVEKNPDSVQSSVTLGMMYLTEHNYEKGLELYMQRSKESKFGQIFKQKVWTKEFDITNKKILLYCDCGLGDTVMYVRYLNMLKKISPFITLKTDKEILSVLKSNFKDINVIAKSDKFDDYDVVIPLMNLQYILDPNFSKVPYSNGYLKADEELVEKYKNSDIFKTSDLKAGLFYRGNRRIFKNRMVDFSEFEEMLKIEGIRFYSFKKDDDVKSDSLTDLSEYINDYSDTAALLKNIDVLVTIDSSIAHMAGALGVKTFLMLPQTAEWRWFNDDKKTIWYDSVKIFRQTAPSDWKGVISRIREELITLCS